MICLYLCIRILQDMIWMSAYSLLVLLKFTIPSMLSWDTSIYTSKPWPFPNKEPPVNGLPGGAPRRLCATVGMVGRAVGAVGSVRVGIVRVGSDGMLSVGSRTWSTSSKGETVQHWLQRWIEAGSFGLGYFSYISWRALSLTLVIDGSNQLLKCGTRVLWTLPILKAVGCSLQIDTLNSSINQQAINQVEFMFNLSSYSAHIIPYGPCSNVFTSRWCQEKSAENLPTKHLGHPNWHRFRGQVLSFLAMAESRVRQQPVSARPLFHRISEILYSGFLQVPIQHVTKKQSIASIGKFYE